MRSGISCKESKPRKCGHTLTNSAYFLVLLSVIGCLLIRVLTELILSFCSSAELDLEKKKEGCALDELNAHRYLWLLCVLCG